MQRYNAEDAAEAAALALTLAVLAFVAARLRTVAAHRLKSSLAPLWARVSGLFFGNTVGKV